MLFRSIRSGATGYGPEAGARSTDSDLWLWYHHSKGVRIEQMTWRAPTTPDEERIADVLTREGDTDRLIPSSEVIWRTRWAPIVALVRPHLADPDSPLVAEIIDAARVRRSEVESWPPNWAPSSDPRNAPEEREARSERWSEIERRCRAAAAAVWEAVRPRVEQETLW